MNDPQSATRPSKANPSVLVRVAVIVGGILVLLGASLGLVYFNKNDITPGGNTHKTIAAVVAEPSKGNTVVSTKAFVGTLPKWAVYGGVALISIVLLGLILAVGYRVFLANENAQVDQQLTIIEPEQSLWASLGQTVQISICVVAALFVVLVLGAVGQRIRRNSNAPDSEIHRCLDRIKRNLSLLKDNGWTPPSSRFTDMWEIPDVFVAGNDEEADRKIRIDVSRSIYDYATKRNLEKTGMPQLLLYFKPLRCEDLPFNEVIDRELTMALDISADNPTTAAKHFKLYPLDQASLDSLSDVEKPIVFAGVVKFDTHLQNLMSNALASSLPNCSTALVNIKSLSAEIDASAVKLLGCGWVSPQNNEIQIEFTLAPQRKKFSLPFDLSKNLTQNNAWLLVLRKRINSDDAPQKFILTISDYKAEGVINSSTVINGTSYADGDLDMIFKDYETGEDLTKMRNFIYSLLLLKSELENLVHSEQKKQ